MDDALARLAEIEQLYAPAPRFVAHVVQALGIGFESVVCAARFSRDDVIEGREGEVRVADAPARLLDRLQATAAAVMHEMAADVQERVVVTEIGDDMARPDLVEQGLSRHGASSRPIVGRADRHTITFLACRQRARSEAGAAARLCVCQEVWTSIGCK